MCVPGLDDNNHYSPRTAAWQQAERDLEHTCTNASARKYESGTSPPSFPASASTETPQDATSNSERDLQRPRVNSPFRHAEKPVGLRRLSRTLDDAVNVVSQRKNDKSGVSPGSTEEIVVGVGMPTLQYAVFNG